MHPLEIKNSTLPLYSQGALWHLGRMYHCVEFLYYLLWDIKDMTQYPNLHPIKAMKVSARHLETVCLTMTEWTMMYDARVCK